MNQVNEYSRRDREDGVAIGVLLLLALDGTGQVGRLENEGIKTGTVAGVLFGRMTFNFPQEREVSTLYLTWTIVFFQRNGLFDIAV